VIDLTLDVAVRLDGFTLEIADRSRVEVLGLFGPSGAGKTTLLEAIAGLRNLTRGEIRVAERPLYSDRDAINVPPRARGIGYVPQDALLFPHLSVRGNLLYGSRRAGLYGPPSWRPVKWRPTDPSPNGPDLLTVADMLEIENLLNRNVGGLSGGERQRVAIGRALMTAPALLLLDEPFAAVDRARRERILPYLLRIRRELHVPLVYVTHDADELQQIADRVLMIEQGRLKRAGAPRDVF
jgi:molybdate transport system ATP-binding protein